jgi:hypothetical protein
LLALMVAWYISAIATAVPSYPHRRRVPIKSVVSCSGDIYVLLLLVSQKCFVLPCRRSRDGR